MIMDNNRKEAAGCFKALPELINSRKWNEVVREIKGISHILLEKSDTEDKNEKDKNRNLLPEDVQKSLRNKFDTVKEICAAKGPNVKAPPSQKIFTPKSSSLNIPTAIPTCLSTPSIPQGSSTQTKVSSPIISSAPSTIKVLQSAPKAPSTPPIINSTPSVCSVPLTPQNLPPRDVIIKAEPVVEQRYVKEIRNTAPQCSPPSPKETPSSVSRNDRFDRLQALYSQAKSNLFSENIVHSRTKPERHPMDLAWKTGSKYLKRVLTDYPDKEDEESFSCLNIDFYMKEGVHPLAWAYVEGLKVHDREINKLKKESYDVPDIMPPIVSKPIKSEESFLKSEPEDKDENVAGGGDSNLSEVSRDNTENTLKEMAKACDFSPPKISTIDYDGYANRVSTLKRVFEGLNKSSANEKKIPKFQSYQSHSATYKGTSPVIMTSLSAKNLSSMKPDINNKLIEPVTLPSVASVCSKFDNSLEKDDDYGSFSKLHYERNKINDILTNKNKSLLQYKKEDLKFAIVQIQDKLGKLDNEHPAKKHMYEALSSLYAAIAKLEIAGKKVESTESIVEATNLCTECGNKKKMTNSLWYDNEKLLDNKFESYLHLCCQ